MRILTSEEMEQVFGGDSTVIPTLPTVEVSAPRVRSGTYWIGYSDFTTWAEFGGGSGGSWYTTGYPAHPQILPSNETIICKASAAAVPGHGYQSGWTFDKVNTWGYLQTSFQYVTDRQTQLSSIPSGTKAINGWTTTDPNSYQPDGSWNRGSTILYAGAFAAQGNSTSEPYYNDSGVIVPGKQIGSLSMIEKYIMTAAHEFQHQYQVKTPGYLTLRPDREADATTYAIKALERFRAGHTGPSCP